MDLKSFSENVEDLPHFAFLATPARPLALCTVHGEFPSSALELDVIISKYTYT